MLKIKITMTTPYIYFDFMLLYLKQERLHCKARNSYTENFMTAFYRFTHVQIYVFQYVLLPGTLYCLKNWKLSMNTTKIQVNNESIVVPSTGAYFLYSRVIINAKIESSLHDKDMVTHYIRYSNTGHYFSDLESSSIKCGVIKNTMSHISYIEKIQYLEKGSEIKVALDLPRDVSMQPSISGGAFGMFKLAQCMLIIRN